MLYECTQLFISSVMWLGKTHTTNKCFFSGRTTKVRVPFYFSNMKLRENFQLGVYPPFRPQWFIYFSSVFSFDENKCFLFSGPGGLSSTFPYFPLLQFTTMSQNHTDCRIEFHFDFNTSKFTLRLVLAIIVLFFLWSLYRAELQKVKN